ncbi:hypothetical protein [Mucilaginibacter pedocola]|uniref:Uncharacterized protein n=1 Tax=Mucilaginibacter pedocola TaxID=1792845 RepID=A0A1S9PIQ3_9SPHI|nr:hypothetical protein [Mucilaginibacter pedocola]OOQ60841.1 hypothetical protein BC343_23015 [Mucilaginibacter pedocola]
MSTNSTPDNSIPLETAKAWAANWRTFLSTTQQSFEGRSFFIPIDSINNLLANSPNLEGVRAYIGLEDETDPLSAKLVMVAVVSGDEVLTLPGSTGNNGPYGPVDMVTVCPPHCPVTNGPTLES